jgi:uncharacterized protein (TIGR01777 family)
MTGHPEIASRSNSIHIAITGSRGLIGSELVQFLEAAGHQVTRLIRGAPAAGRVSWDPDSGTFDASALDGVEAIVHLAGENIAGARWTAAFKRRIRESRTRGTRVLCEGLARMNTPPEVLVSASAIGYYGDRGDEILTEDSAPGSGFLADVARDWEAAVAPAEDAGIRVVLLRFGVVLSPKGGALAKMLGPFRMGGGGIVGSGQQYVSWITLDDAVAAVNHAVHVEMLYGPVNAVAPQPVTNAEFTRTLGRVLSRPTMIPMPAFAARLAFGEMADELLLSSTRVQPRRLESTQFEFRHTELDAALRSMLTHQS